MSYLASQNIIQKLQKLTLATMLILATQFAMADISGNWVLTVDLGQIGGDANISLSQEPEGKLSGSYVGQMLNGPFEGSYNDEGFEFAFDSDMGMYFIFKGGLKENGSLEGSIESMGRILGSFNAKKLE